MQLFLTDRLTCPRCGPAFGLILLADDLRDRLVHAGVLGCSNCRDSFRIESGFADLRAPPRGELPGGLAGPTPAGWSRGALEAGIEQAADESATEVAALGEEAARLVALLGIQIGPGTVALVGEVGRMAVAFGSLIDNLHVVVVDADSRSWPEHPQVSRMVSAPGLPFFDRSLRGVVMDGRLGKAFLLDAARTITPRSRLVVLSSTGQTREVLEEAGLSVLAEEGETVVAARG